MLLRAIAVVLMSVLDVDAAFLVVKPGQELDAPSIDLGMPRERSHELVLDGAPVEIDIVVASHDDEGVPRAHEQREAPKYVGVVFRDASQLVNRVIDGAPEAPATLVRVRLGLDGAGRGRNAHPDEVHEIARDDEAPGAPTGPTLAVPIEQCDQVAVAARARCGARRCPSGAS